MLKPLWASGLNELSRTPRETVRVAVFPSPPSFRSPKSAVARRGAEHAEAALTKATARTAAVEKQKQEIEARFSEAKEQTRAAASEVKKRAQTVADAERALAKARAALDESSER